jgi:CRISPR system Cascade subunit CasE
MAGELRMVRMRLESRRLFELARRRRLPSRADDVGYLVHCQLKELFGDDAPGPFSVQEGAGHWLTVLGYTARADEDLVRHARTYADPGAVAACDLGSVVGKEMPADWPVGARLGFTLRACPVVRLSSAVMLPDGGQVDAGAEVDVFLARAWRANGELDRETVQREWLAGELARRGGARLVDARVEAQRRSILVRRTHGTDRRSHLAERPDVQFGGTIEVTDAAAFGGLLARGVGRHRAFGFGMLLLRPPRAPC